MKSAVYLTVTLCLLNYIVCLNANRDNTDLNTSSKEQTSTNSNNNSTKITTDISFGETDSEYIGSSYFIGDRNNKGRRIHRESIQYNPRPWLSIERQYSYSDPAKRIIKAISCYDHLRTDAVVEVIAGGVGFSHVTLKLTSAKSHGLDFAIEIFA